MVRRPKSLFFLISCIVDVILILVLTCVYFGLNNDFNNEKDKVNVEIKKVDNKAKNFETSLEEINDKIIQLNTKLNNSKEELRQLIEENNGVLSYRVYEDGWAIKPVTYTTSNNRSDTYYIVVMNKFIRGFDCKVLVSQDFLDSLGNIEGFKYATLKGDTFQLNAGTRQLCAFEFGENTSMYSADSKGAVLYSVFSNEDSARTFYNNVVSNETEFFVYYESFNFDGLSEVATCDDLVTYLSSLETRG